MVGSSGFSWIWYFVLIALVVSSIAYSIWMELRSRRYISKEEILQ